MRKKKQPAFFAVPRIDSTTTQTILTQDLPYQDISGFSGSQEVILTTQGSSASFFGATIPLTTPNEGLRPAGDFSILPEFNLGHISPESTGVWDGGQYAMRRTARSSINVLPGMLVVPSTLRHLQDEGALDFPNSDLCFKLLQGYFQWFHPYFPIIDCTDFMWLHNAGKLSPLLLQAVLFISTTYCEDDDLDTLGLGDRQSAKAQLYNRAKILFEAEWESDKLTVTQATFLLSFRLANQSSMKGDRFWLGIAVEMAQSSGLHRQCEVVGPKLNHRTVDNRAESKAFRIARILWWSIYVRRIHPPG